MNFKIADKVRLTKKALLVFPDDHPIVNSNEFTIIEVDYITEKNIIRNDEYKLYDFSVYNNEIELINPVMDNSYTLIDFVKHDLNKDCIIEFMLSELPYHTQVDKPFSFTYLGLNYPHWKHEWLKLNPEKMKIPPSETKFRTFNILSKMHLEPLGKVTMVSKKLPSENINNRAFEIAFTYIKEKDFNHYNRKKGQQMALDRMILGKSWIIAVLPEDSCLIRFKKVLIKDAEFRNINWMRDVEIHQIV